MPSTSTQAEPDARALAELADLLESEGVPAVFTESLGPDGAQTYIEMVRTNAQRNADASGSQ